MIKAFTAHLIYQAVEKTVINPIIFSKCKGIVGAWKKTGKYALLSYYP
jgi:hypothetical protein